MTSRCSFPLTVVTISFPFNAVIKQLLDSVFEMSRIIEVSLRLITLPIIVYNLQL